MVVVGFVFLVMILLVCGMIGKDMVLFYVGLDSVVVGEVIILFDV